jgi:hypothetical protein
MRKLALVLLPGVLVAGCSLSSDEPASRDLTLLTASSVAAPAVASARELDRPDLDPRTPAVTGTAPRQRLVPVRTRAKPAATAAEAELLAPVPAPAAEPAYANSPAPTPSTSAAGGGGMPLEPGQSVAIVPAGASTGPGQLPETELISPRSRGGRTIIIMGDDRCVPGRGELFPGLRHFRH